MTEQELQQQIDSIRLSVDNLIGNPPLKDHQHTGFDSTRVEQKSIVNRELYVNHTIIGTGAATAANYGVFYIVPMACVVVGFSEVHQTAGSDAGAVTVGLEKLTSAVAPGSGSDVLSAALSLKTTADTVQDGVLTTTLANKTLAKGDRLALEDTGVLTAVANVTVKVELLVL